ncbi:MAG: hypothetical protein HQL29_03240 [Candidatus Omnitrophica bacterium]|nr:hypothetical protein [Candidatus Omnitrophota bacterium]
MRTIFFTVLILLPIFVSSASGNELYDQLLEKVLAHETQYRINEFVDLHKGETVTGVGYICDVEEDRDGSLEKGNARFFISINDKLQEYNIYSSLRLSLDISEENRGIIEDLKEGRKVSFAGNLVRADNDVIRLEGNASIEVVE